MESKHVPHPDMDKLMIDPSDGDIIIVLMSKDMSFNHNGWECWECDVLQYSTHEPDPFKYMRYKSLWEPEHFDDLIPLTPTTMKLYGPPELLETPLWDIEAKLRATPYNNE